MLIINTSFVNFCSFVANKIHISQDTYDLLQSFGEYSMSTRGVLEVKVSL